MASKGERNNNPGNLEASPWTRAQPGYVRSDGRFAIFDTMANGVAAQVKLLEEKYLSKGYDTVNKIIWRYGNDPGVNDDQSVRNYAKYVAGRLGINIGDKIDPNQLGALSMAMREFETGKTKKGVIGDELRIDNIGDKAAGAIKGALGMGEDGNSPFVPDSIENILNGKTAARWVSVAIGIILIGLAVAAFVLKDNITNVVKEVVT